MKHESTNEPVAKEREAVAVWLEKECDEQYLADRVRAGDYAKEKSTHQVQKQEPVAYANKVIGSRKWLSIHASKGASDKWLEYRVKEQAQNEEYEQFALYLHPQDQKKDEALRLALEALKFSTSPAPSVEELQNDAITAIEQALENK